jgi:hypothetical protein
MGRNTITRKIQELGIEEWYLFLKNPRAKNTALQAL